jgi:hypothetical protein
MRTLLARLWETAVSPAFFTVVCLLWCLDLGVGSFVAYADPARFGRMDALPFARWLAVFGPATLPASLWVYLMAGLTWLMTVSLVLCTIHWFFRKRRRLRGVGEVLVHLGFLLVFAGYVVGSLAGERVQGVVALPGSFVDVPDLGLSLRLDRLDFTRSPSGRVLDTVSRVTVRNRFGETSEGEIRMNHPLMRGPLVVYPRDSARAVGGADILIDGPGRMILTADAPVHFADGSTLVATRILQPGQGLGPFLGPGVVVALRGPGGETLGSGYLAPLTGLTEAAPGGARVRLLGLTPVTAAVYDIHTDPGVWLVLAGAVILTLGTLWALAGYLANRPVPPDPDGPDTPAENIPT